MALEYSKKGHRKISSFFARGMFYDYFNQYLDVERERALKQILTYSRDAQLEFEQLQRAHDYLRSIGRISMSEKTIEEIVKHSNIKNRVRDHFNIDQWSPWLKWSIEGLLVAGIMSLLLNNISWGPLINEKLWKKQSGHILTVVEKTKPQITDVQEEDVLYSDTDSAPTPSPTALKANAAVPQPEQQIIANAKPPSASQSTQSPPAITTGEIYRGEVLVGNLSPETADLVKIISELGGRKAGSVGLGWQKSIDTSYFHFTIPSAKLESLSKELEKYSKNPLKKESHSRVMPEGITRVILEVKQNPMINKNRP